MAGEQIRLLVIEDVPQVASHMRSLLNAQTQIKMLEVVNSGERAVATVAEMRPDIVIVDALLQGRVSGTHVAEAIRNADPTVAVIMLTVPQNPVAQDSGRGIDAVLKMPFTGFDLTTLIRKTHEERSVDTARSSSLMIALFSPKGGVGRTTLAYNLAVSLGVGHRVCLVDGSLQRDDILRSLGIDSSRRTVLYAPTWTPYASLNAMGEELVTELGRAGFCVIVKLHDNSRDSDPRNSGGVNWVDRLTPILQDYGGHLAARGSIAAYLVAADVMISDHSSAGFEYLLLDRPLIRIEMPELIARTNIHADYVDLLVKASSTVRNPQETVRATELAYFNPAQLSMDRKAVADDLFYKPGTATTRAVTELYKVIELSPAN